MPFSMLQRLPIPGLERASRLARGLVSLSRQQARSLATRVHRRLTTHPVDVALPDRFVRRTLAKHGVEPWFYQDAFRDRRSRWDFAMLYPWIAASCSRQAVILEVGCGCALSLVWLAQHGFSRLYGSDLSAGNIAAGVELAAKAGADIQLWAEDGLEPARPPVECDLLVAVNWTFLIPGFDLGAFLATYAAFLRPGGAIVIDAIDKTYDAVPNNQYRTSDWHLPEAMRHPTEYTSRLSFEDVAGAARTAGFTIERTFSQYQLVPKTLYVLRNV
jgi:hypothetical protein